MNADSFSCQDAKPAKKNNFLLSPNLASFAALRESSFLGYALCALLVSAFRSVQSVAGNY